MATRPVIGAALAAFTLFLAACSSEPAQQSSTPAATSPAPAPAAADASHEGHGAMRAYFVEPKDGATVSSKMPVKFVFAADSYTISPVPQGEVKEVRPNMGHFHLGVDEDCLPPGTDIPRGKPNWVHFGDGKNQIEMQLTPGKHRFAVQVGDDLHRTVAGLCETISVNVE